MDIDEILDAAFRSQGIDPHRIKPNSGRRCAAPDCGNFLSPGNSSGVCRSHNHVKPYCQCFQCKNPWRPQKRRNSTSLNEWRAGQITARVEAGALLSEAARSIGISYNLARKLAGGA